MIQLFAARQSTPTVFDTELDTTGTRLELNVVVQDMNNLLERKSPHSLTFDLPFTETNNKFFKAYYDLNAISGYNKIWEPHLKTPVQIRDNGTSLLDGTLQLLSIDKTSKVYKCVVLGTVADVFFSIKEATWRDIVGIELDHESTAQNVVDSWDITNDITNGAGNGVVVYPLIDSANRFESNFRIYFNFSYFNNGSIGAAGSGINPADLKPAVKVRYLFEKIVNYAGYAVNSTFFNSDRFDNLYMAVGTEFENLIYRALYGFNVGRTTNLSCPANTATAIAFTDESSSGHYDPDNLIVGGVFVAPAAGSYQFHFSLNFSTGGTGTFNLQLQIVAGTENYSVNQTYNQGTTNNLGVSIGVTLTQSQQAQAYIIHNASTSLTVLSAGSEWSMDTYDIGGSSQTLDMPEMLITDGVSAFFKNVIQYFNLAFIEYEDDPTTIVVEPWTDLVQTGNKKDWTNKIDRSQSLVVSPTTEFQKSLRKYIHSDESSNLFGIAQPINGDCIITNDNEFATEVDEFRSIFSVLRLTRIPTSNGVYSLNSVCDALIPIGYDKEYQTTTYKPWLGYYNGPQQFLANDASVTYFVDTVSTNQFPFFDNYNEFPTTSNTIGLTFVPYSFTGLVTSYYFTASWNVDYWTYKNYHQRVVTSLRDKTAKILDCFLLLDPQDVQDLKWNDKIFIDQDYYRVIELGNFSVGNKRPVKARLIKSVEGAQSTCGLNWVSSNADGTTNWEDAAGATSPTQICCEENGLMWDEATGTCRWKRPTRPTNEDDVAPVEEDGGIGGGIFGDGFQVSPLTNYSSNGVSIGGYSIPIQGLADDTTSYVDLTTDGISPFTINLRLAHTYQVNLRVTGIETSTTGVFGQTAVAEFTLAYNYNTTIARAVGTVQTVMSTGDWTISVQPVSAGTSAATLSFQVQGVAGQTTVYSAIANVMDVDLSSHYIPAPAGSGDALWQDGNTIAFQNGDEMIWNG
jgi:hypothetical protein